MKRHAGSLKICLHSYSNEVAVVLKHPVVLDAFFTQGSQSEIAFPSCISICSTMKPFLILCYSDLALSLPNNHYSILPSSPLIYYFQCVYCTLWWFLCIFKIPSFLKLDVLTLLSNISRNVLCEQFTNMSPTWKQTRQLDLWCILFIVLLKAPWYHLYRDERHFLDDRKENMRWYLKLWALPF